MGTKSLKTRAIDQKRVALYARVSTDEQNKGLYPSCESQIEELERHCHSKSWRVIAPIVDPGYTAGTLKRPGLTELRGLVREEKIDLVLCTWYDRFTRSREFFMLDGEFKKHNVGFLTLHDHTERFSAMGRFMETVLVGTKIFEREQTGEKVRTKLRMRAEKGMWNGGLVPYGFQLDKETQVMSPDPEKVEIVRSLF